MKEIQRLLKIVSDGLKTIAHRVDDLSGKVDENTKSQTAAKPKAKKSALAVPKKKTTRKTDAKVSKKKTAKIPTAAETVYKVISKSKKGVDTTTLMQKTGYDRKKVANMVYRLGKQGKIKSLKKGVYVKG
jgi:hypothetical protein